MPAQQLVRLRRAEQSDCRLLWEWANDPAVRTSAFSSEPVEWGSHQKWFSAKLQDADCCQFIALDTQGQPVGQIRFDVPLDAKGRQEAEVDVSVAPEKRGLGLGTAVIRSGVAELTRLGSACSISAWIKEDNFGSQRTFAAAGFREIGRSIVRGHPSVHYQIVINGNNK